MHIADPLSRAYLPSTKQNQKVKEYVWIVNDMRPPTEIRQVTLSELRAATESDAELELLTAVIKLGWPENLAAVPLSLFLFCDQL